MSDMSPVAWVDPTDIDHPFTPSGFAIIEIRRENEHNFTTPLYTADQLAEAVAERDLLIRDLRKELNERRYGRSAAK
ncbi:hypothetical protein HKD24_03090 [Gluconobacter sp. LMG 31484]|uniref:Uncharacterized protein n=1 Tax=Gluconobacter vitians TaxID=2728102 RepID=A0ABR9Y2N4_9PROT|nr:hypothetical protein [Gluconobacter vitians]MBF0858198.1 hypothetical protein [Gluconobacter vitians]